MSRSDMNNRNVSPNRPGEVSNLTGENIRLDELFRAYREACADPEPSVNFMPAMWAKIEAREASGTAFSRMAKWLVTAALGASVVMALLSASYNQSVPAYEGSYVQALAVDHVSDLEPLQVERISELEQ